MVSSPKVPDPYTTANAQFGANMDASTATHLINQYDENTPFGQVRTNQIGSNSFTDSQGNQIMVPKFERNVTLDPAQQQILDQQNIYGLNLATIGAEQTGQLRQVLNNPFDPSQSYSWDYSTVRPEEGEFRAYTPEQLAAMTPAGTPGTAGSQTAFPDYEQWKQGAAQDAKLRYIQAGAGFGEGGLQDTLRYQTQSQDDNWLRNQYEEEKRSYELSGAGHTPGTAGSAGVYTGPGEYWHVTQRAQGPTMVASDRADYIPEWAMPAEAPELATEFGDAWDVRRSYGPTDYSEDRRRVEDAWMDRYNQHFDRQRDAFEQQQINRGNMPGSAAYGTEYETKIGDPYTDAVNQAILMGGQEQSRLAQLAAQQAAFENAAQAQQFGQQQARGMFSNDALAQNYALAQNAADVQNALRIQDLQYQMAIRNQLVNEPLALASGVQLNVPQFMGQPQTNIAAAPIADLVMQAYSAEAQNAANSASGMFGVLGNLMPLLGGL